MNDELRPLESKGIRLVVAMLLGLGVIVGSIVLLYLPWDLVVWIPAVGLAIAVGIAIIPWRPLGYVAVGWSGLLVVAWLVLPSSPGRKHLLAFWSRWSSRPSVSPLAASSKSAFFGGVITRH
jgi:hypothetical protein